MFLCLYSAQQRPRVNQATTAMPPHGRRALTVVGGAVVSDELEGEEGGQYSVRSAVPELGDARDKLYGHQIVVLHPHLRQEASQWRKQAGVSGKASAPRRSTFGQSCVVATGTASSLWQGTDATSSVLLEVKRRGTRHDNSAAIVAAFLLPLPSPLCI